MNAQKLSEIVEHLERAKDLLYSRDMKQSRFDDAYHSVYLSVVHDLKILKNELHYAEKDKLAEWSKVMK